MKMDSVNEPEEKEEPKAFTDCVLEGTYDLLDTTEIQIEEHRKSAIKLSQQRQELEGTLASLRNAQALAHLNQIDRDEVIVHVDRLTKRLESVLTVEMVPIIRSDSQQKALAKAEDMLGYLWQELGQGKLDELERKCKSYMEACSVEQTEETECDSNFERLLLECNIDDQKSIKANLVLILENLKKHRSVEQEDGLS